MSDRNGSCDRLDRRRRVELGVPAEDAQEQEVRDPDGADVDDGPGDDLVDLVADPEPGEQEAEQARRTASPTEHADQHCGEIIAGRQDPRDARRRSTATQRADQHLALERDVEHPAPLGQDARPSRPASSGVDELERAGDDDRSGSRPCPRAGSRDVAATHGAHDEQSHGRQRNAGPADELQDRRRGPRRRRRRSTARRPMGSTLASSPPCRSTQKENVVAAPEAGGREVEREDAERDEDDAADPRVAQRAASREALARRDHARVRRGRLIRCAARGGHTGSDGPTGVTDATSGAGFGTFTRQIDRIRPGAATNMMTSAMMKNSRSNGIAGLDAHRPCRRSSARRTGARPATTPLGRRPASSASAMALKPTPPERSIDSWPTVPTTRNAAGQPGEAAGQGHRQHHRAAGAHARVARRRQVEAGGAELEAHRRPEEQPRDEHGHEQRDDEAEVEPDGPGRGRIVGTSTIGVRSFDTGDVLPGARRDVRAQREEHDLRRDVC